MIAAIAMLAALVDPADRRTVDDVDTALVARHRGGDPEAFAMIYRAHVDAVYRRLGRILGPIPDREDLTQDVFLALHKGLPGFRGEAKLSTLLHRIAINRAREHLRVQRVARRRRWTSRSSIASWTAPDRRSGVPQSRGARTGVRVSRADQGEEARRVPAARRRRAVVRGDRRAG
ncbi:MAG: sigma-70 family RNA polymerase sigma factor [Myxococcales bacterium]|nr:sigma-70 family RNA polymerase sigma factor [Myxococcales bacterium]